MKKFITIVLLFAAFATYSQTVNDKPLSDIDVEFVQIVGTSKFMSTKLTIEIDFGQYNNAWISRDTQLKDVDGKLLVFNSMIDALNFMTKQGYYFVTAYALTIGNQNVYHFMLQKKRKEEK
jgi:hypothetical protein